MPPIAKSADPYKQYKDRGFTEKQIEEIKAIDAAKKISTQTATSLNAFRADQSQSTADSLVRDLNALCEASGSPLRFSAMIGNKRIST